jgi:hypothetical protein
MEGCEEEVARAVAREDAARPVRPVGCGGETQDHDAGVRVAETGDGTPPVSLVFEGGSLFPGDLLAPGDEARAVAAGDDLPFQSSEFLAVQYAAPFASAFSPPPPSGRRLSASRPSRAEAIQLQGVAHEVAHDLLRLEHAERSASARALPEALPGREGVR